ncbi:MAG: methyltransferase domain-containing protein, partial [Spirochaetales bacterium]|nr:methyltransferase domain-containing protein [Spirochaetales bacterium]
RAVGPGGHVVGVDMTPEMVEKARRNARVGEVENVEFVLGEIEALPLSDDSVDVVISNCVVNLSPEKGRVFAEVFRVLKPGGRLAISDIIAMRPMTEAERADMALYGACVSGAETKESVVDMLRLAGFEGADVEIGDSNVSWKSIDKPNYPVASAIIRGSKPLS